MAEKTGISWCDATFNPWWGCVKVSPACDHCYAERDSKRFAAGRVLWGVGTERRTFGDEHWQAPLRWAKRGYAECMACGWRGDADKAALRTGIPGFDRDPGAARCCPSCDEPLIRTARRRVFCASMGDWLDLDAPLAEFVRLLDTIRRTPALDWLLLTKRIGNWRKRLEEAVNEVVAANGCFGGVSSWAHDWLCGKPPANVVMMSTVVNQEEADRDIPKLLAVPARWRGVSIEPMLGPIDLTRIVLHSGPLDLAPDAPASWRNMKTVNITMSAVKGSGQLRLPPLDWVIAGGESGPHARPMHPDWVRSLRDQCAAAGVPFHFKQWGGWIPSESEASSDGYRISYPDEVCGGELGDGRRYATTSAHGREFLRIGTAAAGRLLDGVLHDAFPQP